MRINTSSRFWFLLLLSVLLANSFLPITSDEAYYLTWSRTLDWGYFDHPPLVAWMGALSRSFAPRIPFTLIVLIPLFFCRNKNVYPLLLAVPGAHLLLGGILPDTLMVAVGFLLLWRFKCWIAEDTLWNTLLLGLSLGLLGLSKYHGILLVIALAIGYWPLRKRRSLYLSIGIGALLLLPHLWWQFDHDWVTFKYHLLGRFVNQKPWYETLGFLLMLLLLWWPIAVYFKKLPLWSKVLALLTLVLLIGAGLKGSVEMHWSLVLIWILPTLAEQFPMKLSQPVVLLSLATTLIHFAFLSPQIRSLAGVEEHFRSEVAQLENTDLPAVFLDSYQDAALFEFYTKKPSYALMHPGIRRSQYNLGAYPFTGDTVWIYNRLSWGEPVAGTSFHRIRRVADDLSQVSLKRLEDRTFFVDTVPDGYNWVVYYYRDRKELERRELGSAKLPVQLPEVENDVDAFLTLEKRWVPSQLWVDIRELVTKKSPTTSEEE